MHGRLHAARILATFSMAALVGLSAGGFTAVAITPGVAEAQEAAGQEAGQAAGQRRRRARRRQAVVVQAKIAGEIPAAPVSRPGKQSDWPSIAVTRDGATWVAWVEWNGKDADRVLVRRRATGGSWGEPVILDDGSGDTYSPAIAARGESVVVCWSAQKEAGNFDLLAARVDPAGRASSIEQITQAPHGDFNARAVSDAAGNVTLVWQSLRAGQSDVYARRLGAGGGWGPEVRISPGDAGDWQPAVALDSSGRAWIAWDGYQHGNYDVFVRSWDGERLGDVILVTGGPRAQFHVSIAVDLEDRVWIAWDVGCPNWGKDLSTSSRAEGNEGLHGSRSPGIRVLERGRLRNPAADLSAVLSGRMRRYAELPTVAVDGEGGVWLIFRHWTTPRPTEMYHLYATRLTGEGWVLPWRLGESGGRNSQYPGVARDADGNLLVVYSSDGRAPENLPADQIHSLTYQVQLARLERRPAAQVSLEPAPPVSPPESRFERRPRYTTRIGEREFTLLYGDCHRHTDIRGHSGVDGSLLDTLRYAHDAAQLDYLGPGDHNEVFGGRWPDGLRDYSWWYTQKLMDLHTCAPTFIGLFSYEHSMSQPAGHRNIIFLKRGAPLRPIDRAGGVAVPDNQPPNLWQWVRENVLTRPGQKVVIVPHTFAAGPLADWYWPNAEFDCLLEMYQGARGSYEAWRLPPGEKRGRTQTDDPGHFARDALARGNKYGFVSFSDHRSTHNSYAAVWAESVDREGILDAMLARRTFAATDEIVLDVTAGGHAMGEEFTVSVEEAPVLEIYARAPDTILRVDVVKNGKHVYTRYPSARETRFRFRDTDVSPGDCYYYVRLFQRDPEAPEGDPEMAWASPFYVKYTPESPPEGE